DDATYEKLPKIRVKNLLTGRVIEEPVLPKGQFRVFVPIRLFKAISLARGLAHEPGQDIMNDSKGLLSKNVHNEIEEMRLGFCDPNNCNFRTDVLKIPNKNGFATAEGCINNNKTNEAVSYNGTILTGITYDADNGGGNSNAGLAEAVKKVLCDNQVPVMENIFNSWIPTNINGQEMLVPKRIECGLFESITVTATPTTSKVHEVKNIGMSSDEKVDSVSPNSFSCSTAEVGLYNKNNTLGFLESGQDLLCSHLISAGSDVLKCSEVNSVMFKLKLEEKDNKYKANPIPDLAFTIDITDERYTPFTERWSGGTAGNDCLINSEIVDKACTIADSAMNCFTRQTITGPISCSTHDS
ncbi:MAG: hypothetical protein ABH821_00810, partial [archaeon]